MSTNATLAEVASLVRSKNAGPFWLTIDVFCQDSSDYERIVRSPLTDASVIASIYGADPQSVRIFAMPQLRAVKISLPRPSAQGSPADRDTHAGQQYVPLLNLVS